MAHTCLHSLFLATYACLISSLIHVIILNQNLHFHPDLAFMLQHHFVDTLFASIGQEIRKLHFRVSLSEMIGYVIVRWSVSGDTFGGKHAPSR